VAGFEEARLQNVDLTTLESEGYRSQAPGFDPRSGEGARRFGGRYNPARSFPVVYLCLTEPCAIAELTTVAARQNLDVVDLLPRELWSVATSLEQVLDLTDPRVLHAAGLEPNELTRPDHAFTQEIGEAAHERGVQAIRSASATGVDDVLAIFPENLGAATMKVERIRVWSTLADLF
jgi:RES domain-containing protein